MILKKLIKKINLFIFRRNTIFIGFLCCYLLCLQGCNSIDKKNILPNKKPLIPIENSFQVKKILNSKITDFNQNEILNSGALFSIADNQLFVGSSSGKVRSLDLAGKVLWEKSLKNSITSGPVVFGKRVILATSFPKLFCLDAKSGEKIWEITIDSDLLAVPTISADVVYIRTLDDSLLGISLKDGKQLWRYSSVHSNITLRKAASPVVSGNKVIAGFSNGKLVAFDKERGSVLWSQQISNPDGRLEVQRISDITADPVIVNQNLYAVGYQGNLFLINLSTGEVLWEKELNSYSGFVINDSVLVIATKEGKVVAINSKTGATIWHNDDLIGRSLSKPITFGKYLVVADQEGNVCFLDQKTGGTKGRILLDSSGVFLSPLVVNKNQLYILSNNGYLTIIEIF